MHSTEMNEGLREDFLRIWNMKKIEMLVYSLKLIAGKQDIWCPMKIRSKINSTYMSWISLHEEAPEKSLKIPV